MGIEVRSISPDKCCAKALCSSSVVIKAVELRPRRGPPQPPLSLPTFPALLPWSRCFLSLCLLTELRLFGSRPSLKGAGFLIQPLPSGLSLTRTNQQMASWEIMKNSHRLLSDRQNISTTFYQH